MSKQRGTKAYFDGRHTDYLIEWSMKSDQVLATELNSLFDERYSAADIAAKRAEMRLPPPDREKTLAAAIKNHSKPSEPKTDDRPLSAAKMIHGSKPKNKKPEITETFQTVSDDVRDKIDQLTEGRSGKGNFTFKPVFVTNPVQGRIYVYPGTGPVEFVGEAVISVAGTNMKTISFSEVHALGSKGIIRFDPAKIAEKGIRELATSETMDDLVYKLTQGQGRLKGLPQQGTKQKPFYDVTVASPNLEDLANLLIHAFKGDKAVGNRGTFETTYGNAALHMVAAEYTVVKGVSLGEAMDLLKYAAGKPTIEQLSRYNDGRMSGGPA